MIQTNTAHRNCKEEEDRADEAWGGCPDLALVAFVVFLGRLGTEKRRKYEGRS
jgi:hypothetical protein